VDIVGSSGTNLNRSSNGSGLRHQITLQRGSVDSTPVRRRHDKPKIGDVRPHEAEWERL
jgi:hypothetical protein